METPIIPIAFGQFDRKGASTDWAAVVLTLFQEGLAFHRPDEQERQAKQPRTSAAACYAAFLVGYGGLG